MPRPLPAIALACAIASPAHAAIADAPDAEGSSGVPHGPMDHIDAAERARYWADIEASGAYSPRPKDGTRPAFIWPLRVARGYAAPGFDHVSNYVDHDDTRPGSLRDHMCGTRTYDTTEYNHHGTDIGLTADSWNLMAAGQVEVIAAAPGRIVTRVDGNRDTSCRLTIGAASNRIFVQHDDGSIAWYVHLKTGSLTAKQVGDAVVAGEYLGLVGSSGNSTGPHLHFEVYDASRRWIDPWVGACNPTTATSWWAQQRPYLDTRVARVATASAPFDSAVCGEDGFMQSPGSWHEKSAFAPGEVLYTVAAVRHMAEGTAVDYTIRRPDGSVWRQRSNSAATRAYSAAWWWASWTLPADAPAGVWSVEAALAGTNAQWSFEVRPSGAAAPNYTDLWWNPSEAGWGLNVNHQAETLFVTWFTYDADGAGMWLVMSEAVRQSDGAYAGAIHRATGIPFAQIDGRPAASFPLALVGNGRLRFDSATSADFTYTVQGVTQAKRLQRQVFAQAPRCAATVTGRQFATNYQDLWWNPSEPGWGLNLTHQGDVIFATWFTYGAGGRGQWLVASEVRRQATGEFRGRLYRTTGVPLASISAAPASTTVADVGEVTLTFADGETGRLQYTLDGVSQAKAITRQVFGATPALCR